MAQNYSEAVEELKAKCNIVDVISPLVSLKKTGSNYKGCCPFHKEKTPSFIVSEDRQSYHCFGCGEHGDSIKFIEKFYNLSFTEAVDKLASQYGIQVEANFSSNGGKKKDPYFAANRAAAMFFLNTFRTPGNDGLKYMEGRQILPETLTKFGIGYADDEWQSLTNYLTKEGYSKEMLLELSLASESKGRLYDKFRGRVIFPIINTQGKVIGFGGRIMDKGEPKYLNSSESFIFQKKMNLYGLNITRQEIQKEGFAILVEGYMDVIGLYQSGIRNVAASLGTALTQEQAKLLSRYTKKVVLCYDADGAGIKAAIRGIEVLRGAGLEVKVLHVDDGKDPDEYIKKHGKEEFLNLVKNKALGDVDYKMALIAKKYDVSNTEGAIKFFKAAAGVLRGLSPVEAELYIKKISAKFSLSEGALRSEVFNNKETTQVSISTDSTEQTKKEAVSNQGRTSDTGDIGLEKLVLRLMMLKASYFPKMNEYPDAICTSEGLGIWKAMEVQYKDGEEFDISEIRNSLDDDELQYFNTLLNETLVGEDDEKAFNDCLSRIEINRAKIRINEISDILTMADDSIDKSYINNLTQELFALSQKIKGR